MSIVIQRIAATNTSAGTSHSLSVQVDAGTNTGLLVVATAAKTNTTTIDFTGSMTRDGQTLTQAGSGMQAPNFGAMRFYWISSPNVNTSNVTISTNQSVAVRLVAFVLEKAVSTGPLYLQGTNATTIQWAWNPTAIGDIIIVQAKRSGSMTWTAGGGLTEQSQVSLTAMITAVDTVATGYLFADASTETPTYTLSGGESGSNLLGSIRWAYAAPAVPFRPYYITG